MGSWALSRAREAHKHLFLWPCVLGGGWGLGVIGKTVRYEYCLGHFHVWCECAAHNYLESGYCDMTGDTVWGKSAHSTGWTAIKTSKIQQWQSNCGILLNSGELAATVSKCQFGPGLPSPSRRDQTQFIIPGGRREVPLQVFVETANWDNKPIIVIVTI